MARSVPDRVVLMVSRWICRAATIRVLPCRIPRTIGPSGACQISTPAARFTGASTYHTVPGETEGTIGRCLGWLVRLEYHHVPVRVILYTIDFHSPGGEQRHYEGAQPDRRWHAAESHDQPMVQCRGFRRAAELHLWQQRTQCPDRPGHAQLGFCPLQEFQAGWLGGGAIAVVRGEFFDFTNTPKFGNPTTNIQSSAAGRILSSGAQRSVQLSLKLLF